MARTARGTSAHEHRLPRPLLSARTDVDWLSASLCNASVDLNWQQIDAAQFALKSPLSKGVLLGDEVRLGKIIEVGLVLCQLWAERRRRLLVICPAAIPKLQGRHPPEARRGQEAGHLAQRGRKIQRRPRRLFPETRLQHQGHGVRRHLRQRRQQLENLKRADESSKGRCTEDESKRLRFNGQDV